MLRPLAQDKITGKSSIEDGSTKAISTGVSVSMESQSRTVNWRYAKGRVKLLQGFLQRVDLNTAHITLQNVMEVRNIERE